MAKNRFPYRSSDDKAVEQAQQVLKARYYDSIRSMGDEILQEAKREGYEDYDNAREYLQDRIHETADGSSLVIYTHEAINTLLQSDNWQAVEPTGMELPDDDLPRTFTVAAYYAVVTDLAEHIEANQDEYFTDEDED